MRWTLPQSGVSPLALAVAVGTSFTILALWSGSVPPSAPRIVRATQRPVRRSPHIHRVAFKPVPLVRADEILASTNTSAPQSTVRVLLTKAVQSGRLQLTCAADMLVIDPVRHEPFARIPAGRDYTLTLSADGRAICGPGGSDLPCPEICIKPIDATKTITIGSKAYLGTLEVRLGDAGLEVINEVRREDYIAGVLGGESVPSFPLGALKAQAVAARTYALSQALHRDNGYDVVDTVADQVYVGVREDWPAIRQAVQETAGLIATYDGKPIIAFFSADCGGTTRSNAAAGFSSSALPYLKAVVDAPEGGPDYCATNSSHTWSLTLSEADLLPKLNARAAAAMSAITNIRFNAVNNDGRVGMVEIEGLPVQKPVKPKTLEPSPAAAPAAVVATDTPAAPTENPKAISEGGGEPPVVPEPIAQSVVTPQTVKLELPAYRFRTIIGTNVMRSQIMKVAAADGGGWTFSGKGYGHGVGLCQWGACGMARAGIGFDAILKHYYTNIDITHYQAPKGRLEGVARGLDGAAAPGATVRLAGTNRSTKADTKGRFRFDDLPYGEYDIVTVPVKGEAAVSFAWRVAEGS